MLECIIQEGDYLEPDGWGRNCGEKITKDDGFRDSGFPGCDWRIKPSNTKGNLAIKLKVTGKKIRYLRSWPRSVRVQIEWVGDCEPSTFSRGWLFPQSIQ